MRKLYMILWLSIAFNISLGINAGQTKGGKTTYLSCEDSDNGKSFDTFGTTSIISSRKTLTTTEIFSDFCEGITLTEYYCGKRNQKASTSYTCKNSCVDGECVSSPTISCTDIDGDGYSIEGGECGLKDCNDNNAQINPSSAEICGNSIDENCDGAAEVCIESCIDFDKDGFGINVTHDCKLPGIDCNDSNSAINPGAEEIFNNGVDEDCSGSDGLNDISSKSKAYRAFSDDSYWNTPIPDNAPIDPNSNLYIAYAMDTSVSNPTYLNLSGAPDNGTTGERWSYPIYWVSDGDPEYTITPSRYGSTITTRIPLGSTPQAGSDGGIIIYDLDRNQVTEMYEAIYDSTNDKWLATSTKIYLLDSNGLSKRVSGTNSSINNGHRGQPSPIRAVRIDEVTSGSINHRLECFWHATGRPNDTTPWFYWPMDGYESGKGGITPEGLVLRIKPTVNLDSKGLTPAARIIAQALQDYGCMIGDNSGGIKNVLKLERGPSKWAEVYPDLSVHSLKSILFSEYEFIRGGYNMK